NLQIIGGNIRRASLTDISGLEERNHRAVKTHAESLLHHLESGGRTGFGPFRPKVVKEGLYLIKEVKIDGCPCNEPDRLRGLIDWIEVGDRLDVLKKYWADYCEPPRGSFMSKAAEYQDLCEELKKILQLQKIVEEIKNLIKKIPGLPEPKWHSCESLYALVNAIEAVRTEEKITSIKNSFVGLETVLKGKIKDCNVHSIIGEMLEAVQNRDEKRYNKSYQIISRLQKSCKDLKRRNDLFKKLKTATPSLAINLKKGFTDPCWDIRLATFTE
ncbi:unnamed protein product, partial [marine sediment metagenome]